MAEAKTRPTKVSVKDFIARVKNETRRKDAERLVKLLAKVTGWRPRMWGPTIIGFGAYHYTYESGRTGSSCAVGFSPRTGSLVMYLFNFPGKEQLLDRLGKHKGGIKECLHINKLADVDLAVLEKIVKGGVVAVKKQWPVTGS